LLLETGFLLALNPLDRNHGWALSVLSEGVAFAAAVALALAPWLLVAAVLIAGGYLLFKWSRSG